MEAGSDPGGRRGAVRKTDRLWHRLAVAAAFSLLAHLFLVLWSRPGYRQVADIAVEMEIVEGLPGKPDRGPENEPQAPEDEPPAPEEPPAPLPDAPPATPSAAPAPVAVIYAADAGVADAGTDQALAAADLPGDAGPGDGGGICLHDLFRFGEGRSSWMLWLSMASFRGTEYQEPLAATLGSFGMYRELAGATGMDPGLEVEGLLVTATDPFDWGSFRVVASYDSGEERLKSSLEDRRRNAPGFSLRRIEQGWRAEVPGEYRWQFVSSGRVLVVDSAPPAVVTTGPYAEKNPPAPPPPALPPPENPYDELAPLANAGPLPPVVPPAVAPTGPTGILSKEPPPDPQGQWPRQVTCLVPPAAPPLFAPAPDLEELGLSHLRPDAGGHWPVALLATTDARALGLGFRQDKGLNFRWALVRGIFSDPVRIEGTVYIEASAATLEGLARKWRNTAREAGADPLLAMVGLGSVFERLSISVAENRIEFALPLTAGQVQAALLFIQLQGEAIERRIERKRRPKPVQPISLATLPDTCV
ncbi:MAG TPA: hypothetical protein VM285_15260 [Polyangia bacterium]|nr:hypothetical protein [Polyangia bacterium]